MDALPGRGFWGLWSEPDFWKDVELVDSMKEEEQIGQWPDDRNESQSGAEKERNRESERDRETDKDHPSVLRIIVRKIYVDEHSKNVLLALHEHV